ncbi:MAG TPA: response regulator transcription factor [Candidatus Eisenbacteria bacterium]|nr:response regulator transcription factor [Candidatus Eisenbacteria bacterium]
MTKKKEILVADDDPAICEGIAMILDDAGYAVTTTTDGRTVKDVQRHHPDLIILDIWMSGVDGRDICKQLKSKKQTKNIPIIMISANKDTEKIAKNAGADGFIAKPFEMKELLTTVGRYVL